MNAEQALDQLIQSCTQSFKHLTEDNANKKYPSCGDMGEGAGQLAVDFHTPLLSYLLIGASSLWGTLMSVSPSSSGI